MNTNYTGEDDGVTTLYYTLPGSPVLNNKIDLAYNYINANEYWFVRLIYIGTQWDLFLNSRTGGSNAVQISASNIGTTNAIRVIRRGNVHRLYTRNTSGVWTKRGADITNALHTGVVTARIETAGTWTLSQLTAAPSTDNAYAVLDEV